MERLRPSDPDTIGNFSIIARLGSGGMGVVFLGKRDGVEYALKVMRQSFVDDSSLRIRFEREIDTLRKISSPYVARMVDYSVEEEIAWHAVEYIHGPTLLELVDHKGPLVEDDWWELARKLGEALNSVHELGIIHRDIKPANIIMSDRGPKLIDFGIAQDHDATSMTTTGLVAGSPAWLAPEQVEGREVSSATDLFALGSVLIFAGTGNSPWGHGSSTSVAATYHKILNSEADMTGLDNTQRELVSALHQREPNHRRLNILATPELGASGGMSPSRGVPYRRSLEGPSWLELSSEKEVGTGSREVGFAQTDSSQRDVPWEPVAVRRTPAASSWAWKAMAGLVVFSVFIFGLATFEGGDTQQVGLDPENTFSTDENRESESADIYRGLPVSPMPSSFAVEPGDDTRVGYGCWDWGRLNGLFTVTNTSGFVTIICPSGGREASFKTWDGESWVEMKSVNIQAIQRNIAANLTAVSPNGRYVAFDLRETNEGLFRDCVVVDVESGLEVVRYHRGELMCFSSFAPDSGGLYSNQGDGTIRLWNVVLGEEENSFQLGGHPRTLFATDKYLLIGSGYGGSEAKEPPNLLTVYDLETRQVLNVFEVGDYPEHFSAGPDYRRVFFIAGPSRAKTLWELDLTTLQVESALEEIGNPVQPAVSPDGRLVAISDRGRGVIIFDADQRLVLQVLNEDGANYVSFSRDGSQLYVAGWNRMSVFDVFGVRD